jgi:hypothetical protein
MTDLRRLMAAVKIIGKLGVPHPLSRREGEHYF